MPITNMAFSPVGGLNDATYSPTSPTSEAAIRSQIQGVSDQLRDYINNTIKPNFDLYETISDLTTNRKLDANGNFTGTLNGVPITSTDPGLSSTVNGHILDNSAHNIHCDIFQQALINGNFDIWQRGTTFNNPASNSYVADRWSIYNNIDNNISITKQGSVQNLKSLYSLRIQGLSGVGGTGAYTQIIQAIENYSYFRGQTITFSGWIYLDASMTANALIYDTASQSTTISNAGWNFFSVTKTIDVATTGLKVIIQFNRSGIAIGSGINISQCKVNVGTTATPFNPKLVSQELLDCSRYTYIPTSIFVGRMSNYSTNSINFSIFLPETMRITPTLRGIASTDYTVYTTTGISQTGFTLGSVVLSNNQLLITMNKNTHGLTDGYIQFSATTSGFDAEM